MLQQYISNLFIKRKDGKKIEISLNNYTSKKDNLSKSSNCIDVHYDVNNSY